MGYLVTAAGVVGGGYGGYAVAIKLDEIDQARNLETTQMTLETIPVGTFGQWRNAETGHHGKVTPTRTFRSAEGKICREYLNSVQVDDESFKAAGTACRETDGLWLMAEAESSGA